MERLLQCLDDLDDLYGACGLVWERLRRILLSALRTVSAFAAAAAGIWLALLHPPLALATGTVLFVILLYRSVTVPSSRWARTA